MAQPVDVDTVLDAASTIVLNDGFESTNLRAIGARAGITEKELLQLFSSPGQLFVSLLNREYAGMFKVIVDHMDRDPLGGLLSHIYRHTLGAVYERPLARGCISPTRSRLTRSCARRTASTTCRGWGCVPNSSTS